MFKKLSKVLFSISLAVLTCGAGIMSLVNLKNNASASGSTDLAITIEGKNYVLEGTDYGEGVGTFYKIDTAEDLSLVSFMVSVVKDKDWAKYNYELSNDINLSSRLWTAIGTYDNPFTGKFNGNGYTINGINSAKDSCEAEVFFIGENAITPVHNTYYHDTTNDIYYLYQNGPAVEKGETISAVRGYVLQEETPTTYTDVTAKNYYYYGLFGKTNGAEISDVVLGKSCFAYRNNVLAADNDVEAYSGMLAAYSVDTTFYNIYDAMADAESVYSTEYDYLKTLDTTILVNGKKYYTFDEGSSTYSVVAEPTIDNVANYYEKVFRINTGINTYYYSFNTSSLTLYKADTLVDSNKVVTVALSENKTGSFVAEDKAYYYDYDFETGELWLNLKERYILNSVVETTDADTGTVTVTNSIEVGGVVYYIFGDNETIRLSTTNADPESDATIVVTTSSEFVTLGTQTYPCIYENGVLKVLTYSEVCTLGYVNNGSKFYKGNYYRLNSIDYIGIGLIDENAEHDGTLNLLGTTYYYDYNYDSSSNVNRLTLYVGDYPVTSGLGNSAGIGTISIGGIDYYFHYDTIYKDLDISTINNYITNIPYTIAETEGAIKAEKLQVGTIFSFNTSINGESNGAHYYQKGSTNYINAFRMIYDEEVGLSTLDYNSNFVAIAKGLPSNYLMSSDGEFYAVSDTPGYILKEWTVPDKDTGTVLVVRAQTDGEGKIQLWSWRKTADTAAVDGKQYYTTSTETLHGMEYTTYVETTRAAGADISSEDLYERVETDYMVECIIANNYQVDAVWVAKDYTVKIDVNGTVETKTVGYGMKWDAFISSLSLAGHDLTGVYYYENGITTGSKTLPIVHSYSLNYFYDNYGNLSQYSFLKTGDAEIVEEKEYYTCSIDGDGFAKFTLVENPEVANISSYYEKADNVAIYGNYLSAGATGTSLFLVDWSADTLHFYTTWQRQPVVGKVGFTNESDLYVLTTDTELVSGKVYYTYDATNGYTAVTAPAEADIATYYEKTTKFLVNKYAVDSSYETNGFDGIAMTPSIENNNTDYFVKLDTEDESSKFGLRFNTNTGYKVNYIVPSTTGTFALTDVDYYLYDAVNATLTHIYYNTESSALAEEVIDGENVFLGYFVSATEFIEKDGASTKTHGASGEPFDATKYYVDIYQGGVSNATGLAEVYVLGEDATNLTAKTSLCKDGNTYSYSQEKFTVNTYKLFIDIEREEYEVKITVDYATGLNGSIAQVLIKEDGVALDPIENVVKVEEGDPATTMTVKYDSYYDITFTPAENYSVDTFEAIDMDPLAYSKSASGLRLTGYVSALDYTTNDDGSINHPEIKITLKQSTFDAYSVYNYGDGGKYSDELYTAGATDPVLGVRPIYTDDSLIPELVTIPRGEKEDAVVTNYGNGATINIENNAYYAVETVNVTVYNIVDKNGILLEGINTTDFIVVDYDANAYWVTINYEGQEYLVVNDSSQFQADAESSVGYKLVDAKLYTIKTTFAVEPGSNIDADIIKNNDIVELSPVLKKQSYTIGQDEKGMDSNKNLIPIRDFDGAEVEGENVGNILTLDKNVYVFGDSIALTANLEKPHLYSFKGFYIDIDGVKYALASYNGSSWTIGENFDSAVENVTKLGVITNTNVTTTSGTKTFAATLTLNKAEPKNVTIYAIYEGNAINLKIGSVQANGSTLLDSVVVGFDGGENAIYKYNANVISTSSTIQNSVYGECYEETDNSAEKRTIVYSNISENAALSLAGWAVFDAKPLATNGTDYNNYFTILYTYDTLKTSTGEESLYYYDLFKDNFDLLESHMKGDADLYLVPVLSQKTLLINLTNAGGEGETGNDVTGLTYYAGGNGLDLSSYSTHFAKVGYTAIGWEITSPAYSTTNSSNVNVINLNHISGVNYTGGVTYTAKRVYKANDYQVYFTMGAGETLNTNNVTLKEDENGKYIDVTYDAAYTLPSANKEGYAFQGWRLSTWVEGDGYFAESDALSVSAYKTAGNVTLVPHFTPNSYSVAFNANGGLVDGETNKTVSITYDSVITASLPTRDGYAFAGWYAVRNGNYLAITPGTTILSTNIKDDTTNYVVLSDTTVLTLIAAWERIEGYYSLTTPTETEISTEYTGSVQEFVAATAIKFGTDELDLTQSALTEGVNDIEIGVGGDRAVYTWSYGTSLSNLTEINKGTFSRITATHTNDSGYYRLTIKIGDYATAVTQKMVEEKFVELTSTLHIVINPRTIEKNLEESYTGTFNGTAQPLGTSFAENLASGVNINTLTIERYEIGIKEGTTFTAKVDATNGATYNTIRFYFTTTDPEGITGGNYTNAVADPSNTDGYHYYFDQATSITVNKMNVELSPIVSKIVYTGAEQTVLFKATRNVANQEIAFTANGTLTSGNYGTAGTNTDVAISTSTMTLSNEGFANAESLGSLTIVSNYNYILTGTVQIVGEGVKTYGFAGRLATRQNNNTALSPLSSIEGNLTITGVAFSPETAVVTVDPTVDTLSGIKVLNMGALTYVYKSDLSVLYFQVINNVREVEIYSLYDVSTITIGTRVYNERYHLYNYYTFDNATESGSELDVVKSILTNNGKTNIIIAPVAGTEYYVLYTDLQALTFKNLGDDGSKKYTDFMVADADFTYIPSGEYLKAGFDFAGWTTDAAPYTVSGENKETITWNPRQPYARFDVPATWTLQKPDVEKSENITIERNAEPDLSKFTLTAEEIIGSIRNYNSSITYTFKYYNNEGALENTVEHTGAWNANVGKAEFERCNTSRNGTWKLEIIATDTLGNTSSEEVTFTLTVNTVEFKLDTTNTFTTKSGYFVDETKVSLGEDGKFEFNYVHGKSYEDYIFVTFSNIFYNDNKFALSESVINDINLTNRQFTVSIVQTLDGNGVAVNKTVSKISEAGTYRVTITPDAKYYHITGNNYFDIVINKAELTFSDTTLRGLLGNAEAETAFEKTFGDDNTVLTKVFFVGADNVVYATAEAAGAGNAQIVVDFAGNDTGMGFDDSVNARKLTPNDYKITKGRVDNANFTITVSATDIPYLNVKPNANDELIFEIDDQTAPSFTYGDTIIKTVSLVWNGTQWELQGLDAEGTKQVTWNLAQITANSLSYLNDNTEFTGDLYTFKINPALTDGLKDAGTYSADSLIVTAKAGAMFTNVKFATGNILTINKKEITINTISKEFDGTTSFDSAQEGNTFSVAGVLDGDSVALKGTFADKVAGTHAVNDLELIAENYALASTTFASGTITSSDMAITVELANSSFEYGQIKEDSDLSTMFTVNITNGTAGDLKSYITISNFEVVDEEGNVVNSYSTGKFLNKGTYKIKFTLASSSLDNANETLTKEFEVTTITRAPHSVNNEEITKVYDGNNSVKQVIVIDTLTGDEVIISATYKTIAEDSGIEIILVKSGADSENYVLDPSVTLLGNITAREGLGITIDNSKFTFVADNQKPYFEGASAPQVNAQGNFDLTIPFTAETIGEDVATALGTPKRQGYTFEGFYTDAGLTVKLDTATIIDLINSHIATSLENFVVYTNWTINTYSITETVENNSTLDLAKTTYNYFEEVAFTVTANRGYSLTGVEAKETGKTTVVELANSGSAYSFKMPAYDVTISRTTSANVYTIAYDLDGGSYPTDYTRPESFTFNAEPETVIADPVKTGHTFAGWIVNGTGNAIKMEGGFVVGKTTYDANISLKATWTANTYRIYFDINTANETFVSMDGLVQDTADAESEYYNMYYKEVVFGTEISLPETTKAGFGFEKWTNKANGSVVTNGDDYLVEGHIVVKANYIAGQYELTVEKDNNMTVIVYMGSKATENEVVAQASGKYALTGGNNYIISVVANAGYEVIYDGEQETSFDVEYSPISDGTLTFASVALEHTITVNVTNLDEPNLTISVKVDGEDVTIAYDREKGYYQFSATTDAIVAITAVANAGYTLNTPVTTDLNASQVGNVFTINGYTTDASIKFTLTANTYDITINKDEAGKVTDVTFAEGTNGTTTNESSWIANVTTGKGTLKFVPTVSVGYVFKGVQLGSTVIGIDEIKSNINDTTLNIGVDANGNVSITGYTEAITVTLLTEKQEFSLTLNLIALNDENKNDAEVVKTLKVNGSDYDPNNNNYIFNTEIVISAEINKTGYKFVGWFTAIAESEGVYTYDTTYRLSQNNPYSFSMADENITFYAVFEISYVDINFTVFTNDSSANVKGGNVLNADEDAIIVDSVLYKSEKTYTAEASRGYKFVGWYVVDGENVKLATEIGGYQVEEVEKDANDNVIKSTIKFSALDNTRIYAKFEAKTLEIDITKGLLVNGTLTYPVNMTYGTIEWGTYDTQNGFVADADHGTEAKIYTKTDDVVYVKAYANEGYLIDQIVNNGKGIFAITVIEEGNGYKIYELSQMNADDESHAFIMRYYSTETVITINYVTSTGRVVEGGHTYVVSAEGLSINANRSSKVVVNAITGATVQIVAYTRLGYHFVVDKNTQSLVSNMEAEVNGTPTLPATILTAQENTALGYTQSVSFTLTGFAGGYINLSLVVKVDSYNVELYGVDENLHIVNTPIVLKTDVAGGELIELTGTQKDVIKNIIKVPGYTLQGFYTYANGSGIKYINALGEGVVALNDNGYYWNGTQYQKSPYYREDGNGFGTFSLFAVYTIDKTAISITAAPYDLKTVAPTVAAKVVIDNLNNANSWTVESDEFYVEVLYGAIVNAKAPTFAGYRFAFWKMERIDALGNTTVRYNPNQEILDLLEVNSANGKSYATINLSAIYYVHAEVAATSGGSATIEGYTYNVSADLQTITPVKKIVSGQNDFSSLDTFVYKANPMYGYTFQGWADENGDIVYTSPEVEFRPEDSRPMYLQAVFVGDAKTLKISADESTIGSIVAVRRFNEETFEEEVISDYSSFDVKVGDMIYIDVVVQSVRYEAVWAGGDVMADMHVSDTERRYIYVVKAEDEILDDVIAIHASYITKPFVVTVNYDLANKVVNEKGEVLEDEVKLAGKVVYDGAEIASGYSINTYYGSAVVININTNINYKVSKIIVDEIEIENIADFIYGGTLRIQTTDFVYDYVQNIDVKVIFERIVWIDEVVATHVLTGKGDAENPFKIASEADLAFIAYMINEKKDANYAAASYELTKDIDLTGKYWAPIGVEDNKFTGSFDFNVFQITGINVKYGHKGTTSHEGLFGITLNAKIFKTENNIGLIIGIIAGGVVVIGVGVGIFLGIRAKKKREHDKLANS